MNNMSKITITKTFLKLILVFTLLVSSKIYSQYQFSTAQEKYNSNGCLISVELKYTIANFTNPGTYRLYIFKSNGELLENRFLGKKNDGTFSAGVISISSTTKFELRKRRGVYRKVLEKTIIHCQNDRDSDGVLNNDDNCPDTYGNSTNFGCPGTPNYVISGNSEISAPAWGSYDLQYASSSNNPIFFARKDGFIYITKLLLDNMGDGDGQKAPVKINFYISKDEIRSNDDFKFSSYVSFSEQLVAGGTTTYSSAPKIKLYGSSVGDKLSFGWYYLIISIDEDNYLNSASSGNTYSIPLEYIYSWTEYANGRYGKISNTKLKTSNTKLLKINQSDSEGYKLNIYDFTGNLLTSTNVNSTQEENNIICNLSPGIYIIKTPFGVKKVSK